MLFSGCLLRRARQNFATTDDPASPSPAPSSQLPAAKLAASSSTALHDNQMPTSFSNEVGELVGHGGGMAHMMVSNSSKRNPSRGFHNPFRHHIYMRVLIHLNRWSRHRRHAKTGEEAAATASGGQCTCSIAANHTSVKEGMMQTSRHAPPCLQFPNHIDLAAFRTSSSR
jgi:hypothetical protein